nr:hypothetical protein [Tanacetum cinerariifolium]
MFNMNERVYNPQSQIQSVRHLVSLFHPQASQVIYPQPLMFHPQASQVIYPQRSMIHPQSYQVSHPQSSHVIHQQTSQAPAAPIQVDSSFVAPYFLPTDDPLECLHKALKFMSTILASSFLSSNNHIEILSDPVYQDAIKERQTMSCVDNSSKSNDDMARKYTHTNTVQHVDCFKQKMLLVQLQEAGIQLTKDQLAILADTRERIDFGLGAFTVTTNALFQADGVEVYDSDCDDLPNAQPSFMANISSSGSYALSEDVVHNSTPSAQQDALILSVIEQLRTQVMNCTKINLDNKSVNDTLTAKLERYKEQVKFLTEGKNVDLTNRVIVSDSCEQSVEIDRLKQTLSEQVKEKESLIQTVTLLKNDFKKEEYRNIDREIVLEKKIKLLDNIVFKRDQSAQTVHMLTKPQSFYVHPIPSNRPITVKVPSELPKVSMVNTSLQKLKRHLAGFDVVVKERTTATAILFVKAPNDLFNTFDQYLIDELTEVQNVFHQMEQAVDQHRLESKTFNFQNERLLEQVINKDIVNIVVDASVNNAYLYDSIKPACILSKEQYDAIINQVNLKSVKIFDLNVSFQEQAFVITALKEELRELKGKAVVENAVTPPTIAPVVHKIDLEPLSPKLKNNREAHVDYIRITKENTDTLRAIVEQARTSNPLDNVLAYACMYTKQIQELLVYISDTCPSSPLKSEKLVVVTPMNKARKVTFTKTSITSDNNIQIQVDVHQTQTTNKSLVPSTNEECSTNASRSKSQSETKNNRIMQPLSKNQKYQKVEAHTRNAKPSLPKEDRVSKSVCLTCNKCYFDASYDLCVVQYLSEVNDRDRVKAVKSMIMKEWKPTGKMFENVGYKWVLIGRTFTIVGTKCPLTRFTSTKIAPPRKPVKSNVITNIKPSSASQWSPKETNHASLSSTPKIVESRTANHLDPNNHMGSNVSISPCSSSVQCSQNWRDQPKEIPLDSVKVPRYDKRSKSEIKGKVTIEMELVLEHTQQGDTSFPDVVKTSLSSYPPLPTQGSTPTGNTPGMSSYANVTGKPSGKKVNVCTLFTPGGNGIDVVVSLDSIRAISERFANTAYDFFLEKKVACPVVANYVRNTWGKYGLVRSMFSSSTGLFSFQFSSMDGLDAMLENGPWFIWNNPLILKKWHPDENLLKEDVSTNPVWVKLHGVPVTAFSEDGLSAIATKLADMELKDNIVVAMSKITREGHYTCNNTGVGEKKTVKKPSQTSQGVEPTIEVTNSNLFDVFNSVDNDGEFGTNRGANNLINNEATSSGSYFMNIDNDKECASNTPIGVKIDKIERHIGKVKLRLLDNDGNPLVPMGIVKSDSEVELVFDETANLRIPTSGKDVSDKGYGTNSLLEQWRDSYPDNDDYMFYLLKDYIFKQNALQTLLLQIHAEIREEFRTSSGPSNTGGNPPPFFPRAEQERLKREYHSIRQKSIETSTEFMQRFLRLAGFLGAAVGTEEEQAKNFQWGLRRQRSGDWHQPTSQQSSHRSHGQNNDRHVSDRRGGNDNHRGINNNNYSGSNN